MTINIEIVDDLQDIVFEGTIENVIISDLTPIKVLLAINNNADKIKFVKTEL